MWRYSLQHNKNWLEFLHHSQGPTSCHATTSFCTGCHCKLSGGFSGAGAVWHGGWIVFCHTLFVYGFKFWKVISLLCRSQFSFFSPISSMWIFLPVLAFSICLYLELIWLIWASSCCQSCITILWPRNHLNQIAAKFFEGCPDFWNPPEGRRGERKLARGHTCVCL